MRISGNKIWFVARPLKMERTHKIAEIKDGINKLLDKYEKINVLQLHNPRDEIKNWDELLDMFEEYKKKGTKTEKGQFAGDRF